jgi:hypothetical protein
MVRGQTIPASVHRIFYYCIASICFHFDFLSRVLHQKNKLQASHFFNHIPSYIKDAATVKYPLIKTEATPTFTCLPPHITILAKFEQLKIEIVLSRDVILKGVEEELDKRRIGSQSHFNKEEVISRMLLLHKEIVKMVDGCGRSLAIALQDASFSDDPLNEIF